MSQLIEKTTRYLGKQFFTSQEFPRLLHGLIDSCNECGINSLFGMNIRPLGKLAKDFGGVSAIPKALKDLDAFAISTVAYFKPDGSQTTLYNVFSSSVNLLGSGCGTFKWLGTVGGVAMLSRHVKVFGYVKSVCSVYSASMGAFSGLSAFYRGEDDKERLIATGKVAMSLCSIWLNGLGGLSSYVGSEVFAQRGLQPVPSWTYSFGGLVATGIAVATNISKLDA